MTKQITSAVLGRGNYLFTGVALIEYPRKGVYSLAFITEKMNVTLGEQEGLNGKDYVAVFIPTTPNPTSGMMIFVKESELVRLNIRRSLSAAESPVWRISEVRICSRGGGSQCRKVKFDQSARGI